MVQVCNATWDKAGDMSSMVTAIIVAGRNWTIDYYAGEACDVVIKVLGQSQKHVCNVTYDHYNYMETML